MPCSTGSPTSPACSGPGSLRSKITAYAQAKLDAARSQPAERRTGLLAVLVDGIDTGVVEADEVRDILVQLFNAGTETTSSLIATAIETLAAEPDRQEELRRRPERIPDAVEAILNDAGPFQFHYRYATRDTTLAGTTIPAQSRVLLMWAAANRPDPTALDPDASEHDGDDGRRIGAGRPRLALRLRARPALLHRRAPRPARGPRRARAAPGSDLECGAGSRSRIDPSAEHLPPPTYQPPCRRRTTLTHPPVRLVEAHPATDGHHVGGVHGVRRFM